MKNEQVDNGIHSTRAMDMGIVPAELPGFVCSINKYRYSGRSAEEGGHWTYLPTAIFYSYTIAVIFHWIYSYIHRYILIIVG